MNTLENRRFHYRSRKIIISSTIAVLFICNMCLWLKSIERSNTSIIHYYAYRKDDTSCHIHNENEWLNHLNKDHSMSLKPLDSRIFFHETSCKGGLTSREACAVESAARANPDWKIEVFFVGPIHEMFRRGNLYKNLQEFENVNFSSIDLIRYFKGSPIESVVSKDIVNFMDLNNGRKKPNIVDLLKYLTLYKFGGVSLELDYIVVNSFNDLAKSWASKQFHEELGVDALAFSNDDIGRMMVNATMIDISTNYNPFVKDRGLGILTRVLEKICSTKKIEEMAADTCKGFELYDPSFFSPVTYDNADLYFSDADPNLQDTYTAYAHRMWSEITKSHKLQSNSRLLKLAKLFCPTVCDLYGDDFGI